MAVHRPTLFNLMNSIVGVSVLAIPYCFHQCGIVLGSLAMVLMMYITKKTCLLLLLSAQLARRRSYESLAQFTYGNAGKLAVEACIIGLMAGTLCAFNVIIGDLGPNIAQSLFEIEVTPSVRATIMISLAFGVGLPLSLMRDISSLANLSAVSLLFYASFVFQAVFNSLPHLFSGEWINTLNLWKPAGFLQSLSIFALAFSCQTQLFGLYDSIPEPSVKKMDAVVHVGMNAVCSVYLSVGFFSYVTFYDVGVKGDILTNYGGSSIAVLLKIGFMLSVIVSFPLMVFPMRASINSLLFPSQTVGTENMPGGPGYMPQSRFFYITVSVISLTLTVGVLIPQIEFVLGLTGATMGMMISMILPASMFLYVVQETKGEHRTTAKIILAVGFICLIASTYTTLTSTESHHHDKSTTQPSTKNPMNHIQTTVKIPTNLSDLKSMKPQVPSPKTPKDKLVDSKEINIADKKAAEKEAAEDKRKEPALPNAPVEKKDGQENVEGGALKDIKQIVGAKGGKEVENVEKMEKVEKVADPLNEKRQLMSADETKGNEPLKSSLVSESSLLAKQKHAENKMSSNKSNGLDTKDVKKPDRGKRNAEEKATGIKGEKVTENVSNVANTVSQATTVLPTSSAAKVTTASLKNSSIVIIEPKTQPVKTALATESTKVEASSPDPHVGNKTGKVLITRDLKSSEVIGRKLHSLSAQRSIWERRLKKHGLLKLRKERSRKKLGLS